MSIFIDTCLTLCGNKEEVMKIKIEIELDTDRDANEIQDLIEIVERIRDREEDEES
jgi:hypothetical protein